MVASLDSVFAKLHRARKHLDKIRRLVEEFREPNDPYGLVRHEEFDGVDTTTFRYEAHIERPIPVAKWGPIIGDFLYGARSALDHLAWQLSILHCDPERPPIGVRFPIFTSERKFFERMRDGKRYAHSSGVYQFRAMSDTAQARVLELQPYKRRQNPERDPLFILHQLCNQDKHEAVPVVASTVEVKRTILKQHNIDISFPIHRRGPFHERTEVLRVIGKHTGPDSEMEVQTEFWVREAFDKVGPAAGEFVTDQLRDIYNDIIEEVVPRFREFFP